MSRIHAAAVCEPPCPFHAPSDHAMATWPKVVRASALIERRCPHGIGHPDPDSLRWMAATTGDTGWGVHGCDGCCIPAVIEDTSYGVTVPA